ncbi:hypothetical protein E7V67_005450 [[Empedobacter] haloabium]|uniref:Uncharacterized protein n=1 Tax=[Empedobacter] haloabium TaxID=592317 RepID=A0ABZ1UR88_9BURK
MRKLSPENEKEFEELAKYVNFYTTHVWRVSPEAPEHPSHFLTPVPGKVTKSQLLSGLRQAANDTVEDASSFTQEQTAALDRACLANDVLTLSEVRRRFSGQYRSVLKKRRISNETEYYLVVAIITDMSSQLDDDERRLLEELAHAYEEASSKREGD